MYIRLLCVLALSRCVVAGAIRSDNQQHGSRYFFDFFRPDAIVITANFSDEYENATDERSIRLGADKTKFYHNYEVFEPEFPNDEGKRIASRNNSVPSYVPWSPDPLAQLRFGSWAKKEVITTTVVVQETKYTTVYPSCVILQDVHSLCEDEEVNPVRPTDIWRAAIPNPERDLLMDGIAPTAATVIRATETVRLHDTRNNNNSPVYTSQVDNDDTDGSDPNVVVSTPELNDTVTSVGMESLKRTLLDSLFQPGSEIVTESSTAYKTVEFIDYKHMATIRVENCLPHDLLASRLPLCHVAEPVDSEDAKRISPATENPRIPESNRSDAKKDLSSIDERNSTKEAQKILPGVESIETPDQDMLNKLREFLREAAEILKRVFKKRKNNPSSASGGHPSEHDVVDQSGINFGQYIIADVPTYSDDGIYEYYTDDSNGEVMVPVEIVYEEPNGEGMVPVEVVYEEPNGEVMVPVEIVYEEPNGEAMIPVEIGYEEPVPPQFVYV